MNALEFHPLANLFPLVEGEDFRDLVADVAAHGIHQPIDVWQGKILDGRNRYRAAQAAGIELGPQHIRHFRPELYGDPLAYVISANLKRRHLDDRQRASIAGKIANLTRGRPAEAAPDIPPIGGISAVRAAAQLNVAPRQVERARVVHEQGVPELREALDRGELAVSAAEKIARLPEAEQRVELPKALPSGARAIMGSRAEPDDSLDYFPTPPWATRALVEVVLPQIGVHEIKSTWEPACGEGHIAEVLREYCPEVTASDVHDYGYGHVADFLGDVVPGTDDWIITNPPFNDRAERFALRALEWAGIGVAMFFRLQWLETVGRYERVFAPYPPAIIAQFAERVPLCKGRWNPDGSTATAYLWIVWLRGAASAPTEFYWVPPGQRERLERSDDRARFTAHPVVRRDGGPIASIPNAQRPSNRGVNAGDRPCQDGVPQGDPFLESGRPFLSPHLPAEDGRGVAATAACGSRGPSSAGAGNPERPNVADRSGPAPHESPANADDESADMDAPRRESAGGVNVAASRLAGGRTPAPSSPPCAGGDDDELDIPNFLRRLPDGTAPWMHASSPASPDDAATAAAEFHGGDSAAALAAEARA